MIFLLAKLTKAAACTVSVLTMVFALLYQETGLGLLKSLAITFGTFSYHFLMRLAVGYLTNGIFHNRINYSRKWFQPHKWEEGLYQILRVKQWKDHMPTFAPDMLDIRKHSWEEIAGAMCQAEIVHTIIAVCSFLPIAASLIWESFPVFFLTSLAACCIDCLFVIIQRYNRPRVLRIIEKKQKRSR
ncbi:MAG: hypothetical protein MJ071_09045 [Oscillospiraceae bacterium]|nr:hypothetical protein [Oscillospiraceae bacterium]